MEASNFKFTDSTPIAALNIGQFRDLVQSWINPTEAPQQVEQTPEMFGKTICSQFTGYSVNTINKMICERQIPYYKINGGKVIFKRDEIREWLLSNRVQTSTEFIEQKESELSGRRARK